MLGVMGGFDVGLVLYFSCLWLVIGLVGVCWFLVVDVLM